MQTLTREQVNEVLEFSQALYIAENSGYYSPWMSNQLMKNLNTNPRVPTTESIKKALTNYKDSSSDLQAYTEFMSNYDMIFKRTLMSYVNMLAFDYQIIPTNAFTQSDLESDAYAEDLRRVYNFCDKFRPKEQFRRVVYEVMQSETYFTWFRKTKWGNKGMKFALQVMPQQYCMLTGAWELGLLYDFDMAYFLQPGVDIDGYDPSFKTKYNQVFGQNGDKLKYRPTAPLNDRTGEFAMWVQTSPDLGAFCFKMNTSNFVNVPYLAPFLKDALSNSEIEILQNDKDMLSAYAILAGEIRLMDGLKAGDKPNQLAISPEILGSFMGKAKAGLGRLLKLAAMPTENSKFFQFNDSNPNMYENQLRTSSGVGSGISRVIYTSDRMSNAEIEAGVTDQFNTMAQSLYPQFANFMNFYANKMTKKYHFKFIFEGCTYSFEREKRFDKLMKLADKGMVLAPSAWASAMGMEPMDFERSLRESKYSGWSQYWQMPMNAYTQKNGMGGRPELDDSDLSDSGEMNRDS